MKENVSASLLWLGAAISVAEILTGVLIAPLGFTEGFFATLLGHLIGCVPLFFVALAGVKSNQPTMQCTRISFGKSGSYLFSGLNILQLVGWTSVMIFTGAAALTALTGASHLIWCIVIGVLIALWCVLGPKNISKLNIVCVSALFILCVVLSFRVFGSTPAAPTYEGMTFGSAVELSAAMPLSWLPLIADYTQKSTKATAFVSVTSYFIGSTFMFVLGLGAALCFGVSDLTEIFALAGLGIMGVIIVILSTVTTTFLDAYSAGISAANICTKLNEKLIAVIVTVIGAVLAILFDVTQYENFLYLIGSVFAPMTAVFITDYFITKRHVFSLNLIMWAIGVIIYRLFMQVDFFFGTTLPAMIITGVLTAAAGLILIRRKPCSEK